MPANSSSGTLCLKKHVEQLCFGSHPGFGVGQRMFKVINEDDRKNTSELKTSYENTFDQILLKKILEFDKIMHEYTFIIDRSCRI